MTDLVCFEYGDSTYFSPWASHNLIPCPSMADFISSTDDWKNEVITAFPNPNHGSFNIQVPTTLIGSTFVLHNSKGQIIESFIIQNERADVEIRGERIFFYTIKITSGESISGKIVVMK